MSLDVCGLPPVRRLGIRRSRVGAVSLALVAGSFAACGGSGSPSATREPGTTLTQVTVPEDELQRELDALVAEREAPGAVLTFSVRGQAPVVLVSGIEPGTNRPLAITDQFRVASITKTFVAAEMLSLVDEGQAALDDHLEIYLPDWPHADEISLRQLLDHTSGVPPLGGDRGAPDPYSDASNALVLADLSHHFTPDEILAFVRDRPLLFPPGTSTSYSNVNTILLGKVISEISGLTLGEALHQDLLDPLSLTDTHYAAEEPSEPVAGLQPLGDTLFDVSAIDNTADITSQGAAGAMVMTMADLLSWGESLLRDRTIAGDSLADDALTIGTGGTGLGVLGFSDTHGFCVFADQGCPTGEDYFAVGASGSGGGTRTVLLFDAQTDTVIAFAMDREGAQGIEAFSLDVMNLIRSAN